VTLPTFLVLGAARSATTSLHYYLEQHPAVTMSSIKEPNFFAFDHTVDPPRPLIDPASPIVTKSVRDRGAYERLFAHAGPGDAVGEASPLYLYVREAPEQIARLLGTPQLIAVLRNPIDRAYSHWLHIHRDSADHALDGFRRACEEEMTGGRGYAPYGQGSHVLRMGLYDEQIARYDDRFGAAALLTLVYERLTAAPRPELDRVCDHLGVAHHDFETETRYNPSGVTRSRAGAALTAAMRSAQPTLKAVLPPSVAGRLGRLRARFDRPDAAPPLPTDLRQELAGWFAPSVERLVAESRVPAGEWEDFS
jgi:hypothetical protein